MIPPGVKAPIRRVGLTGSIATGKSTAAKFMEELGICVVDADKLAREVIAPGTPGRNELSKAFGEEYFLPDGSLDRPKLGGLVFGDPEAKARLEGIIHPLVSSRANELMECALAKDPNGFAVYNVPLLYETGLDGDFDLVVVVHAPRETEIARIIARDGLSRHDAQKRVEAQLPIDQKSQRAHVTLDNSGSVEDLKRQTAKLVEEIRALNGG